MFEATPVIQATLKGCAANVGPQIGVELEVGEIDTETSSTLPEGVLAVLPLSVEIGEDSLGFITLSAPIEEIVVLARRMLGDDEPDKERDLSSEDLEACGEVLNLMAGAADQSFREEFGEELRLEPRDWWCTNDPGEDAFAEGEHLSGVTTISVPGGPGVHLTLRFPIGIVDRAAAAQTAIVHGCVLLAGLGDGLRNEIVPILEAAKINVETVDRDAEDAAVQYARADVIVLSSDREGGLDLLRSLRKSDATWKTPSVFCLSDPTHESVVRAVECGASHLLKVPISEPDLLRILASTQS